jgi:AraC-like DNA-binding protein
VVGPAFPQFLESHYHTPSPEAAGAIPVIYRAGHLRASADYRIARKHSQGYDLLLCLKGAGHVEVRSGTSAVAAGELAWISGYEPHAHWADPADPWELLWIRIDGVGLAALYTILQVAEEPIFRQLPLGALKQCFRQINAKMATKALNLELDLYPTVAQLISILWRSRQIAGGASARKVPAKLETVLNRMAVYPDRRWTAADLARLAGMSVPQFYRVFRQATGSSPIDWLRRGRISLAKRRLLETTDPVKNVADQVGYNSPFFFSRDFKRYTGQSPSGFRKQESHAPAKK